MSLYQLPNPIMGQVYFDHNATTPVCTEVVEALPMLAQVWGNPSSIHWAGRGPKNILRDARKIVADSIGSSVLEIIFTSGASESNNTVFKAVFEHFRKNNPSKKHFVCSAVEHPSVMKTMMHLQELGAKVDFVPVNRQGELDLAFLETCLSQETALVSVMLANNETGTVFPIKKVVELAKKVGALVHTDGTQALSKIPVDVKSLDVDYASFSAHKVNAIKGTGFTYVKKGSPYLSLLDGGGQERHRRGGTENVLGIAALGLALSKHKKDDKLYSLHLRNLRDHFEKRILEEVNSVSVTAGETERLPNTSSLVIDGCDGETLLMSLDIKGYAVSTGAACSSGNPEPSPVLLAMGITRQQAQNSLRVSFGINNTLAEVDQFIEVLKSVVNRLRSIESDEV